MLNHSFFKRATSLLLAAELFLAPAAMARAANPLLALEEGEKREEPGSLPAAGKLLLPENGGAGDSDTGDGETDENGLTNSSSEETGAELLATDVGDYIYAAISPGRSVTDFGVLESGLTYELEGKLLGDSPWLFRTPTEYATATSGASSTSVNYTGRKNFLLGDDGNYYLLLPNVGRVPDYELDGFYVLGTLPTETDWYPADLTEESVSANTIRDWRFDEDHWQSSASELKLTTTTFGELTDAVKTKMEDEIDDIDYSEDQYNDNTLVAVISAEQMQSFAEKNQLVTKDVGYGILCSYLPIVARWKASNQNTLRTLSMTTTDGADASTAVTHLYTADPRANSTTDADQILVDSWSESTENREFWLVVGKDQQALNLTFETYEPYAEYCENVADSEENGETDEEIRPVSATVTFSGVTTDCAVSSFEMLTPFDSDTYQATNSLKNPARTKWEIQGIPLKSVEEGNSENLQNTIELTVSAPNGEENRYVFHVERVTDATSSLGYGNTPLGMIWGDSDSVWGESEEAIRQNKIASAEYFKENLTFNGMDIAPRSYGALYQGSYDAQAWYKNDGNGNTINLDKDPTALVVYLDSAFDDPGVSFTDCQGKTVEFGENAAGAYKTAVTRTIELKTADALTTALYTASGEACWYGVNEDGEAYLSATEVSQTLTQSGGTDRVDLRGLNVVPGTYTITYTFTDPLNPSVPCSITRYLAVLPIPGDVDMDGAVTPADARAIQDNQSDLAKNNATARLFAHRVTNVAQGDSTGATAILKGFQPATPTSTRTDYYYPPLTSAGLSEQYSRKSWGQVSVSGVSTAAVTLEYLGPEKGSLDAAGHTNNISGPWRANGSDAVTQGDVFWVGVKFTAGDLAGKKLQDLTLTLTYDCDYVQPVNVYSAEEGGNMLADERWTKLTIYNFNMGTSAGSQSLFSGVSSSDYDWFSSSFGRTYTRHYSKVRGYLEQQETTVTSSLREMTFTIQSSSSRMVALKDGYLLAVPFQLKRQPYGASVGSFIELSAGMKDFVLTTQESGISGVFARLASLLTASSVSETRAFSAQDTIFGGATQNLKDTIAVGDAAKGESQATLAIPLGKNTVESTTLVNASVEIAADLRGRTIYGEPFEYSANALAGVVQYGQLPPGLTLNASTGVLTGTPTAAGRFEFTVNDKPYCIEVEKRTLRYAVNAVQSYYGESQYRGENSGDFTFTYIAADLTPADRAALESAKGSALTGAGSELALKTGDALVLAGYQAPGLAAYNGESTTTSSPARANSPVIDNGGYPILVNRLPSADNYSLVRTDSGASLTVYKRPVWIDTISVTYDLNNAKLFVFNSDGVKTVSGFTLTEGVEEGSVTFYRPEGNETSYKNLPLTNGIEKVVGDTISLTFSGTYQFNQNDKDRHDAADADDPTKTWFIMSDQREYRDVDTISNLTLTGESAKNYELMTSTPRDTATKIQGVVVRRSITTITIAQYPPALREGGSVTAGETIGSDESLRVRLVLSDTSHNGAFSYIYEGADLRAWGLHYNWVSPEEYEAGKGDLTSIVGSGCTVDTTTGELKDGDHPYTKTTPITADMNGWYLCVIAKKYGQEGAADSFIKLYSERPITVKKKTLKLTAKATERFYGEENALTYTYNPADLSSSDYAKLLAYLPMQGYTAPTGSQTELEGFLTYVYGAAGFTAPTVVGSTVAAIPNESQLVTSTTQAGGADKHVVLYGGSCSAYQFLYHQASANRDSYDYGENTLTISKRPILVDKIYTTASDGTKVDDDFATIYADTYDLNLSGQQNGSTFTPFSASVAGGEVAFGGINQSSTGAYTYYTGGTLITRNLTMTGDPVLEGDRANMKISYNVTFLPDVGRKTWSDMATNWFDVRSGKREVEISGLALDSASAVNYILVYNDQNKVSRRVPDSAIEDPNKDDRRDYLDKNGKSGGFHWISGKGNVILRPIASMELVDEGLMNYTYGQTFSPSQPVQAGSLKKYFTLKVSYATTYGENAYPYNTTSSETVQYSTIRVRGEDGTYTTSDSFTQRGFTFHYLKVNQSDSDKAAVADSQTLQAREALYPGTHNGARLFITGKRNADDPIVYSKLSDSALTVKKASLTLTATDVHRFYGEENTAGYGKFSFAFDPSDLAQWDRNQNTESGNTGGNVTITGSSEDFETVFGTVAKNGVALSTTATALSGASSGSHDYGVYPIELKITAEGKNEKTLLENYDLTLVDGNLYVYPRPFQISGIEKDAKKPVYTIYSNTTQTQFTTQLDTRGTEESTDPVTNIFTPGSPKVTLSLPLAEGVTAYSQTLADGSTAQLPLSGSALVRASDVLTFNVSATFYDTASSAWNLRDGMADKTMDQVEATVTDMAEGGASGNYRWTQARQPSFTGLYGTVKLRTIGQIYIKSAPRLEYTYPEELNLSNLTVIIAYQTIGGETTATQRTEVTYRGADQFKSYGLYVNYTDKTEIPAESAWKDIPSAYRKASTGDHLTIAPTHDSQASGKPWAANNKYLIISAFQAGTTQTAAQPKILGAAKMTDAGIHSYEGTPTPIQVKPLTLTYDLTATDKTYDGSTKTAGTLTLTNLFDKTGVQAYVNNNDQAVKETVTDAVYVAIGAAYETADASSYQNFTALTDRVNEGQVSFTTGSYENTVTDALSPNDTITWAEGYRFGTHLTFRFVNPNVHYEDENSSLGYASESQQSYWRADQAKNEVADKWDQYDAIVALPVEVTNMNLAGPDAANYTWGVSGEDPHKTSVTMSTRPAAQNGQASAPYATIHKANRADVTTALGSASKLPSLMLDLHSNVMKFIYDDLAELTAAWNNNNRDGVSGESTEDAYQSELHFEYALFYRDGETDLFTQWAGEDGDSPLGYQDTLFFGGETALPVTTAGYQPNVEQLPKEENAGESITYKGQLYPWAEEDPGFFQNKEAYPGGEDFVSYYDWYYSIFSTTRAPLPRDTTLYPLLRLAETHNYNASAPISGSTSVTPRTLLSAQLAVEALKADPENVELLAAAQSASAQVFADAENNMTAQAKQASEEKAAYDASLAESGQWPEDETPQPLHASALKTFKQRFDLVSASTERSQNADDDTEYLVEILEAVWFTDTQLYDEAKQLDAVVWNHPTRYFGYYWDANLSSVLKFTEEPYVDFRNGAFDVTVRDDSGEETSMTVNTDFTARIYVSIVDDSGATVRKIQIVPSVLYARLGDEPFQLGIVTVPERPSNRKYKWSSSDPTVASVDEKGLVTFRGVGRCTITVTTTNRRTASITVVVSEAMLLDTSSQPIFNFHYDQPWEKLTENGAFRPKEEMTRGELALLLDKFLNPDGQWQATNELAYLDIQEGDKYYDALRRLTGAGVVKGIPGGMFAPEQKVTRAEFAAMLARMLRLNLPDSGAVPVFTDSSAEDTWAWAYINALATTGVTRGVGGGAFAPERVLTREESAVILARLLVTKLDETEPGLIRPTDVTPENWSYQSILRAVNAVVDPD